jgi:hypothetical protein
VERLIGSIRRECLDHVITFNESGLHGVLKSYFEYYERTRTHLSLEKDAPVPRTVQPPELGKVVELPEVGGLHHRYERRAAQLAWISVLLNLNLTENCALRCHDQPRPRLPRQRPEQEFKQTLRFRVATAFQNSDGIIGRDRRIEVRKRHQTSHLDFDHGLLRTRWVFESCY